MTIQRSSNDTRPEKQQDASVHEHELIVPRRKLPWFLEIIDAIRRNRTLQIYIGTVMFLAIGVIIGDAMVVNPNIRSKAGSNTVQISVQPSAQTMPPSTAFQLWVNAGNPIAFITVKVVFDPTLIQMTGDLASVSPLTRIAQRTSYATANITGVLWFSVGLDPAMRNSPPSGTFELATIPFAVKTTSVNQPATIHLDATGMQVVNTDYSLFSVTAQDSALTLNPSAAPTATPTPKPLPSPTPTSIPADTTPPTVSITAPSNGSTVNKNTAVMIAAIASDTVGVSKVIFLQNTSTLCTDTVTPYTCTWTPKGKAGNVTLSVKAYDAAGNVGTSSISVTVQ